MGRTIATAAFMASLLILTACGGRYTGDSEYYWQDGVLWSCRENVELPLCRVDSSWPDGGIAKP